MDKVPTSPSTQVSYSDKSCPLCNKGSVKAEDRGYALESQDNIDESNSNFRRQVAGAIKRIESGIHALELISGRSTPNSVSSTKQEHNLLREEDYFATIIMNRKDELNTNMIVNSNVFQSITEDSETPTRVSGHNINLNAIRDRWDSLNQALKNHQTSQSGRYVNGLRIPETQTDLTKNPPTTSVRMQSKTINDNAVHVRAGKPESTSKSSMKTEPKQRILSMRPIQKIKLRHQTILRPTLLDDTSIRRQDELQESSASSSSSQPYGSCSAEQTSRSNSDSEVYSVTSLTSFSSPLKPPSKKLLHVTSDYSSDDTSSRNLALMNKKGHRSDRRVSPTKARGRMRRLKNKLGLIFHHHHHHHHHHHVEEDDGGQTTSMWKHIQGIFHHKSKAGVYEKHAVGKLKKARAGGSKDQVGHFHALLDGLLRHTRHSKNTRTSRGVNEGLRDRKLRKKLHWWQKFKRNRGVKLPKRGHAKVKRGQLNRTDKHKLLTHKVDD